MRRRDIGTIEVVRTDRRDRRLRGKSDAIDAENAARAVLAGQATAIPKTADGAVEMIRQVKVAKDNAVKARTAAMISLNRSSSTRHPSYAKNFSRCPRWVTREELRIAIVTWIERTYHHRQRQGTLGRLTPIEYETIMAPPVTQAA